jgi:NADPH:quinone reductase-like Zn-dependent oxidoreductase
VGADQIDRADVTAPAVRAMPTAQVLESLAADVVAKKLHVHIQRTYPLEDAAQAMGDFAREKLGKLAVAIAC